MCELVIISYLVSLNCELSNQLVVSQISYMSDNHPFYAVSLM